MDVELQIIITAREFQASLPLLFPGQSNRFRFCSRLYPLHPDGIQHCNAFRSQFCADICLFLSGMTQGCNPFSKLDAILSHIICWNIQIAMHLIIAFCRVILLHPAAVVPFAPVHADLLQPVDPLCTQQPFLVSIFLIGDPRTQLQATLGNIFRRDFQISILLIVGGRLCITALPLGTDCIPRHSKGIQLANFFFGHPAIGTIFPLRQDPMPQRKIIFRLVFCGYQQISLLFKIRLSVFQSTFPRKFCTVIPNHSEAVQSLDLRFGQIANTFSIPDQPLQLHPGAKVQTRQSTVLHRYPQISMLSVVNAGL